MAKILLNGVWCDDYLPGPRITQFARCGCTQTCACVIQAGDCITVTGNGGSNTPYTIGYTQGCAKILTEDTNTVDLEGDGSTGNPLTGRVKRVGDNLGPLNSTPGGGANLLKENTGPDGLYVSCEDIQDCVGAAVQAVAGDCLTYNDVANSINVSVCPTDNGLECTSPGDEANCPDGGLLVRPSSDAGNSLDFGSDGRLFSAGASGGIDVLDTDCINITRTGSGTQADPYIISAAPIIAAEPNGGLECSPTGLLIVPSGDAGNTLDYGTDGGLFTCAPGVVATPGQPAGNADCVQIVVTPGGPDCATPFQVDALLQIDPDPCNLLACGPVGLIARNNGGRNEILGGTQTGGGYGQTVVTPGDGVVVVAGSTFCTTVTNTDPCRTLLVNRRSTSNFDWTTPGGSFIVAMELSIVGPAGPWNPAGQSGQNAGGPRNDRDNLQDVDFLQLALAPGDSATLCARLVISGEGSIESGTMVVGSFGFLL